MIRFRADISTCENGRDKILSVCQSGPDGQIQHEVIIQRGPKEYDLFDDAPGPKISCDDLGLNLSSGLDDIVFSHDTMTIVLSAAEDIEVDISGISRKEQRELRKVAKELLK